MSVSDYITKHKKAGTLGKKAEAPLNLTLPKAPTKLTNEQKLQADTARGVSLSQGTTPKVSPLRKLARMLPGNFEQNIFEPVAKVGRALFPSPKDMQRQIIEANPNISNAELQAELKRQIAKNVGIPLTAPGADITADTKILDFPDVAGMVRRVGSKAAQNVVKKGAKSVTPPKTTASKATVMPSSFAMKNKVTPPTASVVTPPVKPPKMRERGFVTSAKEVMPENTRIAGEYVPRSTDELSIKAKNLIKEDANKAESLLRGPANDQSVAVASEWLKKLAKDAETAKDVAVKNTFYDKAATIANEMAEKLTEAGRTVQAASILGRLTPEGQLRFYAGEVAKYNAKNPTKKIPGLSPEETKEILEESKRIFDMPEGEGKAIAFQEFQTKLRKRIPSSLLDKLQAFWRAGLLTGIKTTGLNLASNTAHQVLEIAKDIPASSADALIGLFTGQRTKTATLKGLPKGIKEGINRGWTFWKTGYDPRDIGRAYEHTQVRFKSKVLQSYVDFIFRTISAPDQPMYYGALRRSLRDQAVATAKNEGLKGESLRARVKDLEQNPTEEMSTYALADAETAVFLNQTSLGKVAKTIQDLPGGKFAVPFGRTPSAVAMQVLNYSPVGIPLEIARQIRKGKFDQRMMSQAIGRSVTGSVPVLWLGSELFENDMVSLDYPKTERDRELWKVEGRVPNTIKVNDEWRSVQTLGPAGPVLLMGAHYKRALEETGSPTEAMVTAFWGTAKSFSEATFLRGINDLLEAVTNPERGATNYAASFISSWIPTIINDVARSIDPKERFTSDDSFVKTVMNRIKSRIPKVREGLQEQVDVLGRDVNRAAGPVATMIDPTRPSPVKETPTSLELRRLTDAGFDVSPTRLGDKVGYKALTPDQNTALWRSAGQLTNSKLTGLFTMPQYQKLSDEEKGKLIKRVTAQAQERARAQMVIQLTRGLSGQALVTELARLKTDGLMTEPVFKEYKELQANKELTRE